MKIYLAASSADVERARRWHRQLIDTGMAVTSSWLEIIDQVGDANPREASKWQRFKWADNDLREIAESHALWFLVPTTDKPTRGAWIEFGYARACGPELLLISSGDTKQSIFCALGEEFETDEQAFERIHMLAKEHP